MGSKGSAAGDRLQHNSRIMNQDQGVEIKRLFWFRIPVQNAPHEIRLREGIAGRQERER
jgi:hypothetical protein